MEIIFLDGLIKNIHDNCKMSQDDRSLISVYRKLIIEILEEHYSNIEIINQGSYATFTQITTSSDLDVDIGIVFKKYERWSRQKEISNVQTLV